MLAFTVCCTHAPFSLLLELKQLYKAKQSTMLGFWVVKNHGTKTEDVGDRGRKVFPDSTGRTSPRSLFLTSDGNDNPVSQVYSTMTGLL